MNRSLFGVGLAVLVLVGAMVGWRQSVALGATRDAVARARHTGAVSNSTLGWEASGPTRAASGLSPTGRPSVEVLALRAEVTRLRHELEASTPRAQALAQVANDWSLVWDGVRPSQQPGFVRFSSLAPAGAASPTAAFGTFQYALRNQDTQPLTPTRMKELWNVPDDFDDPRARYSIHLGAGIGGEIGYRVVREEPLGPGLVRLILEMEREDGSSFEQERVMAEQNGVWRLQPEKLERLPDVPDVPDEPDAE